MFGLVDVEKKQIISENNFDKVIGFHDLNLGIILILTEKCELIIYYIWKRKTIKKVLLHHSLTSKMIVLSNLDVVTYLNKGVSKNFVRIWKTGEFLDYKRFPQMNSKLKSSLSDLNFFFRSLS